MGIEQLKQILLKSWDKDTCNPYQKEEWNKDNPSLGQCAITSLIVNDIFGGKIMRCMSPSGSHYYNIVNDERIDLTVDQFLGEFPQYENSEERTREYLLSNEDTKKRYSLLKGKVDQKIIDEKHVKNAMNFYLLATKLKYKIRSGWDKSHWNVSSDRIESIAEHVYGTCILAISLNSEFGLNLDMEKVLKMLTIHEIGEVLIGDITPFDKITEEQKAQMEHNAMKNVLGDLCDKDELFNLLMEFDEHNTRESKFAYLCDKMEADIQAKVYQDMGYQHSLDDQDNNIVFKSSAIKKMIENGAVSAFDIWYEWDKSKFEGEPVFEKTLSYIKKNNTNL